MTTPSRAPILVAAFIAMLAGAASTALAQQPDAAKRRLLTGAGSVAATSAAAGNEPAPATGSSPTLPKRILEGALGLGGANAPGPDTPRGAFAAYIRHANAGRWGDAAAFLDLSDIPETARAETGPLLARRLKAVLDRKLWVDLGSLSADPAGNPDDGLPEGVDRIGVIEANGVAHEINIWNRAPADPATWQVTPGTLRRLEPLHQAHGRGALGERMPEWMTRVRFLTIELWQWAGLALLVVLAHFVALGIAIVGRAVTRAITSRTRTETDDLVVEALDGPVRGLIAVVLVIAGASALSLSLPAREGLLRVAGLAVIALVAWALVSLVDHLLRGLTIRLAAQGRNEALASLSMARRALKAVVILLAILAGLQDQGINVTGLLAGLGIAGIAVSLASQKTLENVFGGVMLSMDQPVRVGDVCKFGDKTGVVEDIGLRSTRIRTPDRTLVSVPNAEFSTVQIENLAVRDKIRLNTTLGLRYETTTDQMRDILERLRAMLLAHEKVDAEGLRVRFMAFGASSLDIEVIAYVKTRDFDDFCAVREDLLLRMMEIVDKGGSSFAFPSRTVYVRRDDGLDGVGGRLPAS